MEHRKGSLNVVPDTLSRFDVDELSSTPPLEIDLVSPEFDGVEYSELRKTIENNHEGLPDLRIVDNRVYKRVMFRRGVEEEEDSLWRLWSPEGLTVLAIKCSHVSNASYHGGWQKTLERVRQKYFWPQMAKDIRLYVNRCETCKAVKATNQVSRPPMGNAFVSE
ncbi:uncharacterized protein LOC118732886, partial [Rhagoletis pomonella]|uniref:uncharacterized protein LOC118732886 n=1 Tax=Rhagoletis pomonella TaxID=28610 RepID=UPI00177D990C